MVTVTKYVWDPVFDCVTHELDENNDVKAVYHNEPQQYGGVLSQRRGTTSHYHHHDALGSTRFLTDSSGNVTDTYLYDAWGNSVASTGNTVNPFKWVGKYGYYTDDSTGQVYVRARMYQPIVARWSSVDPLLFIAADDLYTLHGPVLTIDPSGMFFQDSPPWSVTVTDINIGPTNGGATGIADPCGYGSRVTYDFSISLKDIPKNPAAKQVWFRNIVRIANLDANCQWKSSATERWDVWNIGKHSRNGVLTIRDVSLNSMARPNTNCIMSIATTKYIGFNAIENGQNVLMPELQNYDPASLPDATYEEFLKLWGAMRAPKAVHSEQVVTINKAACKKCFACDLLDWLPDCTKILLLPGQGVGTMVNNPPWISDPYIL